MKKINVLVEKQSGRHVSYKNWSKQRI